MDEYRDAKRLVTTFEDITPEAVASTGFFCVNLGNEVPFFINIDWFDVEEPSLPFSFETKRMRGLHLILRLLEEGKSLSRWTWSRQREQHETLFFSNEHDAVLARMMVDG